MKGKWSLHISMGNNLEMNFLQHLKNIQEMKLSIA